jgi:ribosome maturation factor RimP
MDDWTRRFIDDVERLAEPLLESEGMAMVDVEYRREPVGWVLRVFIDKEGGVTLDDCALVSRQLGDIIDARMDHDESYHLEVSSPGLDRPLTKPRHFVHFQGQSVVIKTGQPVDGQRHFKGVLAGFSDGLVTVMADDKPVVIPIENIVKACLDWESC